MAKLNTINPNNPSKQNQIVVQTYLYETDFATQGDDSAFLNKTGTIVGSQSQAQSFGSNGIKADAVAESTTDAGVTVDLTLIKDGKVFVVDGTALLPSLSFATDVDGGIYKVSDGIFGIASEGVIRAGWNTSGLMADVINEITTDAGVTLDSVLLKDGSIATVVAITGSGDFVTSGVVAGTGLHVNDGGGTLISYWDSTGVHVNTIGEKTVDAGVTIETLLLNDGNLTMPEAGNVVAGTTTGTKIGTVGGASGQKLAFWNATPIVQPLLATGAGHTADDIITYLQTLGLARQS